MKDLIYGKLERRRRTWYRRRLRKRRFAAILVAGLVLALAAWQMVERSLLRRPSDQDQASAEYDPFWALGSHGNSTKTFRHASNFHPNLTSVPGVYPYSVVPGGIRTVDALRRAAAADSAIARHFAQFNYAQARLIRLKEAREVYVSYRIRNTIFWTQKRLRLQAGEMLLTDGKITARAKCGNQVSDTAKPEVSREEPETDILDQPVLLDAIGPTVPLRILPPLPSGEPVSAPPYTIVQGFPYVPYGLPLPPRNCEFYDFKRCHPHKKPTAPEPSTLLLLVTGLGLIGWAFRGGTRAGADESVLSICT